MNESKPDCGYNEAAPEAEMLLRCKYCEKESSLMLVEMDHPTMPNTLTPLKDITSTIWKCLHCGCWQNG